MSDGLNLIKNILNQVNMYKLILRTNMIKLKDLFSNFKYSDYYHNLIKNNKRKYNNFF